MIRAFVCWRELSRIVLIRDAEKGTFDRAAEIAVIDLSAWVRERPRMVARKEMEAFGEQPGLKAADSSFRVFPVLQQSRNAR
jgi:hypothetical protein